jgi:hypothetical protein
MPLQSEFNVWCKWDPLQSVIVGNCVNTNFFEHVANSEIRQKLTQMLIETQEDLDNLAKVFADAGVTVYRQTVDNTDRLDPDKPATRYQNIQMQPRDEWMVLGKNFVGTRVGMEQGPSSIFSTIVQQEYPAWKHLCQMPELLIVPCSWTIVGKDLFIDLQDIAQSIITNRIPVTVDVVKRHVEKWVDKWIPDVSVHWIDVGGHSDACFHTCKPGVILTIVDVIDYNKSFPGWDILVIPSEESADSIQKFTQVKEKTAGKFWIPGEESNSELLDYVNEWLQDWVGYVAETVFDVNVMMINDRTCVVSNYNKMVFEYFKKHNIEPIIAPLRHRYFWDGGIHCCTLDLYRKGECQQYIYWS